MRNRHKETAFPSKIVPSRTCKECGDSYTPRYQEQQMCSRECGRKFAGRFNLTAKTARLVAASRRRRDEKNREIQAELRQQFGELSVREIEIFKFGQRFIFKRGYAKGRSRGRQEMLQAESAA